MDSDLSDTTTEVSSESDDTTSVSNSSTESNELSVTHRSNTLLPEANENISFNVYDHEEDFLFNCSSSPDIQSILNSDSENSKSESESDDFNDSKLSEFEKAPTIVLVSAVFIYLRYIYGMSAEAIKSTIRFLNVSTMWQI
jgi:hypothetical protein